MIRSLVNIPKTAVRESIKLSMRTLKRGPHITRYYMYKHLSRVRDGLEIPSSKILSISESGKLAHIFATSDSKVIEANFPECNMLALPFRDGEFDIVISDQVLEHIEGNPQLAIDESFRVLKPGGLAIHTTCFINPIHLEPGDFWRFTPDALRLLCSKFSQIVDADGFGNPYIWLIVWLGLRFEPVPEAKWHFLNKLATINDKSWPISTWIVARK